MNAPIVIAAVTVISCVFWLVIGASVAGEAAARDVQTRMHLLTYAAPVSKAAYLGGRYLAALALSVLQLLAIPAGMVLAMHFAGVEAEILGPFRVAPYLTTFFFIALPNAFFATALQFSAAALSRRALASYLVGAALFAASYTLWPLLEKGGEWGNLADPMSFGPVLSHLSLDWSPLDKNTRLFLLEGSFLANRLLWLGISLGLLAFTYLRFQFVLPESGQKQKPDTQPPSAGAAREQLRWGTGQTLPKSRGTYGWSTQLLQLRVITWESFRQLAKSKAGLPLLAAVALLVGAVIPNNLKGRGTPLLPRTDFVLDYLTAPLTQPERFWLLIALLTIFYAGELVWRERESGLSEIANAAPVPEWVLFLSRFLALNLVLVGWLAFLMTAGMMAQAAIGALRRKSGCTCKLFSGCSWWIACFSPCWPCWCTCWSTRNSWVTWWRSWPMPLSPTLPPWASSISFSFMAPVRGGRILTWLVLVLRWGPGCGLKGIGLRGPCCWGCWRGFPGCGAGRVVWLRGCGWPVGAALVPPCWFSGRPGPASFCLAASSSITPTCCMTTSAPQIQPSSVPPTSSATAGTGTCPSPG
ncbi:ABC transporter permease [Hymenobacter sp. DG25B]|uniref:ABC transporter permease n=1 Tax=Hymenobacter sp. DG25B TaxID=1385664 RepID=UPI001E4210DC|nr:hypothetical protein [Hymenobacter sp. DG25B]